MLKLVTVIHLTSACISNVLLSTRQARRLLKVHKYGFHPILNLQLIPKILIIYAFTQLIIIIKKYLDINIYYCAISVFNQIYAKWWFSVFINSSQKCFLDIRKPHIWSILCNHSGFNVFIIAIIYFISNITCICINAYPGVRKSCRVEIFHLPWAQIFDDQALCVPSL